ncbi:hypothetical protein L6452_05149 [Arctium lappa]|uniref:Uncharacterized protein n=1 Tax=Arctium lappa TaxID=4217 RepID=A0ACB9EFL3_ARCLA|nr:hypothetical protein L6452_05149 [Arctium lappa]
MAEIEGAHNLIRVRKKSERIALRTSFSNYKNTMDTAVDVEAEEQRKLEEIAKKVVAIEAKSSRKRKKDQCSTTTKGKDPMVYCHTGEVQNPKSNTQPDTDQHGLEEIMRDVSSDSDFADQPTLQNGDDVGKGRVTEKKRREPRIRKLREQGLHNSHLVCEQEHH